MATERDLKRMFEGEAVKLLMAGNDSGCFTTEQFANAKERVLNRFLGPRPADVPMPPLDLVRKQLLALAPAVREVRRDVWTLEVLLSKE